MSGAIKVNASASDPVVVTITAAGGRTVTGYTDATFATPRSTTALTITAPTTWWFVSDDSYDVSVLWNGVEAATDTRTPIRVNAVTGNTVTVSANLSAAYLEAVVDSNTTSLGSPAGASLTRAGTSTSPTLGAELSNGTYANQSLSGIVNGAYYYIVINVSAYAATGTLTVDGIDIQLTGSSPYLTVTGGFIGTASATPSLVMTGTTNATSISIKRVTVSTPAVTLGDLGEVRLNPTSSNSDRIGVGVNAFSNLVNLNVSPLFGNVALGAAAGQNIVNSNRNTFVGYRSGNAMVSGSTNTFVGAEASPLAQYSSANVVVGALSGSAMVNAFNNTIIGRSAGTALVNTFNNTFVGNGAGNLCNGNHNTAIGSGAGPSAAGLVGTIAIGRDSTGTAALSTANDLAVIGTTLTTLKVGTVAGSGSGAWALGIRVAQASSTLDTTQYISVKVDGTVYKLALVN